MAPTDELAEDAFRVVRDALAQSGKAGLGQLAMRGREYLVAVRPCGSGLLLETLHYEEEIRKTDPFFSSISTKKADRELLDVARDLIEKKTAPFEAAAFKDRYADAIRQLVADKSKGRKKSRVTVDGGDSRPKGDNVVDLMSALKKSLEDSGGKKRPIGSGTSRRKKSA